ncbi:MAG: YdeI/OmpD-associated family protein [Cyclobacteriaceae bacterium]
MSEPENVFVATVDDLRSWLAENQAQQASVWLVRWKKLPNKPYISYDALVDELICYGWVDSLPRKLDAERTMIRISPRNPKSNWSKVNKVRVERLSKAGRMQPAGLELVATAKSNGCWSFLDEVDRLIVPDDLQAALENQKDALYYYERFPDSSKRGILEWIKSAKQPATRKKRIEDTAAKASRNIKANHPAGRDHGPV